MLRAHRRCALAHTVKRRVRLHQETAAAGEEDGGDNESAAANVDAGADAAASSQPEISIQKRPPQIDPQMYAPERISRRASKAKAEASMAKPEKARHMASEHSQARVWKRACTQTSAPSLLPHPLLILQGNTLIPF